MRSGRTKREQRAAWVKVIVFLCALFPLPALADTRINAKVRCQEEYGSASELDISCERGVDLAERAPGDGAIAGCARGSDTDDEKAVAKAAACQRGIALHAGVSAKVSGRDQSSFAHSWQQGHGALQLEVGNYDVLLGDAQKSIADCQASFEGSSTPPSCLSGLRIQPKPPAGPPGRTIGP
jgi:hypothetical protein